MASAGAIAGAVGATSITGLTTAASFLGITAVAATPVGWIIGAGVAGAALFGGGAWLKGNSAVQTERRRLLKENLQLKLEKLNTEQSSASENDKIKRIAEILRVALLQDRMPQELAGKIFVGLKEGSLSSKDALDLINAQCKEINVQDVEASFNINTRKSEARNLLKEAYLNKKRSKDIGMQLLNAIESTKIKYAVVDEIISSLSELCNKNKIPEVYLESTDSLIQNNSIELTNENQISYNAQNKEIDLQIIFNNAIKSGKITFEQAQMFNSMLQNGQISENQILNILNEIK